MGYQETIKRCGSKMQSVELLQGSTQHICHPLLSVFAGEDAVKNVDIVKNVYRKCWLSEAVDSIPFVVKEKLDENDVIDNVRAALIHGPYEDYNVFYQVFYWDIMDQNFNYNKKIIKKKPRVPITYEVRRIFYLFARMGHEKEARIAEERSKKLIQWAEENNEHIFIFTDNTKDGFLDEEQLLENYRIAADITVISDSRSIDGSSLQLGFDLMKKHVYSAGYYSQGKNTRQIVATSIVSILDFYRSAMEQNTNEITGDMENLVGGYFGLFEHVFSKIYLPLMPQDTSLFRFLNYTDQMDAFYRCFEGGGNRKTGFGFGFARQTGDEGIDFGTADAAKRSVGPFWKSILELYYLGVIKDVLQSKIDGMSGEEILRYELRLALTSKLSYYQLMSGRISPLTLNANPNLPIV